VKEALGAKAEQGTLTRENIENALQTMPDIAGIEREENQKDILNYLRINHMESFLNATR